MTLTDEARDGVKTVLRGLPYTVMTRENTYSLLVDMGLDPEACVAEANCEVEFGQNIGAALVVSADEPLLVRPGRRRTMLPSARMRRSGMVSQLLILSPEKEVMLVRPKHLKMPPDSGKIYLTCVKIKMTNYCHRQYNTINPIRL